MKIGYLIPVRMMINKGFVSSDYICPKEHTSFLIMALEKGFVDIARALLDLWTDSS